LRDTRTASTSKPATLTTSQLTRPVGSSADWAGTNRLGGFDDLGLDLAQMEGVEAERLAVALDRRQRQHYRIRALLYAGRPNSTLLDTLTPPCNPKSPTSCCSASAAVLDGFAVANLLAASVPSCSAVLISSATPSPMADACTGHVLHVAAVRDMDPAQLWLFQSNS